MSNYYGIWVPGSSWIGNWLQDKQGVVISSPSVEVVTAQLYTQFPWMAQHASSVPSWLEPRIEVFGKNGLPVEVNVP